MYYYTLKCLIYTPDPIKLPTNFFGSFPNLDLSTTSYLEKYKQLQSKSSTLRRRSSQPKAVPTENIPPTPIHTTKSHAEHSLEEEVDFRFGGIEVHEMKVVASSKKKKRLEERTVQLGYGVLHIYRDLEPVCEQDLPDTKIARDESLNISSDEDTLVCVLAVPSYMTHKDFTNFLGPINSNITNYRFIRDYSPNKYAVLLKFKNRQSAFACYQKFNGRRFNMTEPEISHVVYIRSNSIESVIIPAQSYPHLNETLSQDLLHKNKSVAELPTCPVCLERLDESVTGLLSIQCHHTSQCYCLNKWGTVYATALEEAQDEVVVYQCCECDSTDSLWICMICGHIGCGRYQDAHAYDHYMDTDHLYALEIESQLVWDYLGDGYVHRLIQNAIDGALVELPSTNQKSSKLDTPGDYDVNTSRGSNSTRHDYHPLDTSNQQGKLDTISVDYSYMLTSQLDSQRIYYEDQLEVLTKQLSDINNQVKVLLTEQRVEEAKQHDLLERGKKLDSTIVDVRKEKEKTDKRAIGFKDKYETLQKNLNEEKVLTKSLLRNNELLKKDANDKDSTLKVLSDQVRDLMFFLEAREKVKDETPSTS
ncbi:unnamed protein product [Mucor hiemalis]